MESSKTLSGLQSPVISIVTPCYNTANYIERAIRSVMDQDFTPLEHIIVDGASKDGTVGILHRYPHLRWISEPDGGQAEALNKGFRMARGEIIGWLNADDSYTPGAIRAGVEYLLDHPDCDIVYGDCNILREDGSLLTVFHTRQVTGWEQLLGGWIHTPAVFFRSRIFNKIGYLDESLHYVLDSEFWLRAAPYVQQDYLPQVLANFHHQSESKSIASFVHFGPELCRVYEAAFAKEPYSSQIPPARRIEILARCFWSTGVRLIEAGMPDQGRLYLYRAIDEFNVMQYPRIVTEILITRYIQRDVLPWTEVEKIIEALPIGKAERAQLTKWCREDYQQLRFFAAYNRLDWREVRIAGLKAAVQNPRNLRSRGFLSIWAESILGSGFANAARKLL